MVEVFGDMTDMDRVSGRDSQLSSIVPGWDC